MLLLDTADGHLADIDTVLAEDRPDFTDDPWHIVVGEEKHVSIEVGFHAVVIDRDESGHAVAEDGHSGSYGMFTAEYLGGDRGAKCSKVTVSFLDQIDAPFLEEQFSVDDIDVIGHGPLEESGAKGGCQEFGVFIGDFASVVQFAGADCAGVPLGHEQSQPVGRIEVSA